MNEAKEGAVLLSIKNPTEVDFSDVCTYHRKTCFRFIYETALLLEQKNVDGENVRRMRLLQICALVLFTMVLISSVIFAVVLPTSRISLALLIIDFPIALIVAIFGSLSIREEEEET